MVKGARLHLAQRAERRRFRVEAVFDVERIRALLEPRRLYAAYALGQLSPDLVGLVDCWLSEAEGGGSALVLYSRGGLGDAMFCMGDSAPLDAILSLHPGPRQNYITCEPDHVDSVRRFYRLSSEHAMLRMAVTARTLVPAPPPPPRIFVRLLSALDAPQLNRLYNSEGSPTYYSGRQIEQGCYYGAFADDRLVSVAGTHVISREEGIAVVGNVFTHPRWRGKGLARLTTGATTQQLLQSCRDVVLTVDPENTPAVRAYQNLGYAACGHLIEAAVTRNETITLRTYLRRLRARLRGHQQGVELVVR
jgi:RimJ/RimL family protein N-acetyltransferase